MVSQSPSRSSSALSLPVLRVPPGARARISIQSPNVLYVGTHWFNRELLCVGPDCPGCGRTGSRCRGFALGLLETGTAWRPVMLEGSSPMWSRLEGFRTMEGVAFEPGLVVEASKKAKTSPLRLEPVEAGGLIDLQFTSPRRLLSAMAVLFRLPVPGPDSSVSDWAADARPAAMAALEVAMAGA